MRAKESDELLELSAPRELKGFFETRGKELYVWESVCAVRHDKEESIELLKVCRDGEKWLILSLTLQLETRLQVTSEGYWECVEIEGQLQSGHHIYFHAVSTVSAQKMLEEVASIGRESNKFVSIRARLDPNPFRNWSRQQIDQRILEWIQVLVRFSTGFQLVLDPNMPL